MSHYSALLRKDFIPSRGAVSDIWKSLKSYLVSVRCNNGCYNCSNSSFTWCKCLPDLFTLCANTSSMGKTSSCLKTMMTAVVFLGTWWSHHTGFSWSGKRMETIWSCCTFRRSTICCVCCQIRPGKVDCYSFLFLPTYLDRNATTFSLYGIPIIVMVFSVFFKFLGIMKSYLPPAWCLKRETNNDLCLA